MLVQDPGYWSRDNIQSLVIYVGMPFTVEDLLAQVNQKFEVKLVARLEQQQKKYAAAISRAEQRENFVRRRRAQLDKHLKHVRQIIEAARRELREKEFHVSDDAEQIELLQQGLQQREQELREYESEVFARCDRMEREATTALRGEVNELARQVSELHEEKKRLEQELLALRAGSRR